MTPLLPELFADWARRSPGAPAVVSSQGELTYRDLADKARRIARGLAARGAGEQAVVGVLVRPGPDLVAALLGTWLAGACYLPLDPWLPARRLHELTELAGTRVVLTDDRPPAAQPALPPGTTCCTISELAGSGGPGPWPERATTPRQAAYLIFTSGSTGTPKGVVVEHEGIANRVQWGVRTLRLSTGDRVLQKTPLTFDAAGWEIFGPLACGAPVTFGRPEAGRDAGELVGSIRDRRATVVQVVPTMLRLLAAEPGLSSCTSLRVICSAGEALHAELCQRVRAQLDVEILNTYGPTECSVDVLAAWFDPAQQTGPVPIGWPIDNMRCLLLPPEEEPAAGEPVYELCAGGPGVARGYHGDAARTAERFAPEPGGPPGARMYRTGDLVREAPSGALVFAGRADTQIKINGVRIEPAEVETALQTHPEVAEAAVHAVSDSRGTPRLASWVVTTRPGVAGGLAAYLRDLLPAAMIPVIITEVGALPRTTSGKTDHARLPEPDWSPAAPAAAGPGTAEERIVLAAWRRLLDVDEVGLDDDFFRLGGHSLLMTQLAAQLTQESGLSLDFRELHYAPTAREQVRLLASAVKAAPVDQLPPGARLPLSHAQERFWILDQINPGSREYLLPVLIWLPREAPEEIVREALSGLVARHEVLRTRYVMDAEGLAAVAEPTAAVPVRVLETTPAGVSKIVAAELAEGFDLRRAPLLRASLIRDGGDEQLLLLVCHHIICDGWSARLLEEEFRESVAAITEGRDARLPGLPLRYVDAVAWQRAQLTEELLASQLGYWRETLAGVPALELPGMHARDAQRSLDGAVVSAEIPPQVAGALLAAGRRAGAAPYVVFATLWTVALAQASGQWDFGVGSPCAARSRPELHDLVGPLIDVVVIRPRLAPDLPFEKALAEVEFTCRESFARHAAPFDVVVDAVAPRRDLARTPLFQAYFALADDLAGQQRRARDLELLEQAWTVARTDLSLTLWPLPDGRYGGALEYASALYDEATAASLASLLRRLAERFAADPGLAVGAAPPDSHDPAGDGAPARPAHLDAILGFARDLLGRSALGPDDDFIDNGGNSLLAARLLWHVQTTFDVDVSMRAFFGRPTAAGLADEVERLFEGTAEEDM
jgi:amino acid adenylation domain-containing protein